MSQVKTDASKLPESNDASEIRKQVEFYFSDENLPTDKFLWKTSKANNGWVPIATIHSFKRMRRFQPEQSVVDALVASDFLEVKDGQVRRKEPLKEPSLEEKKDILERTIYAKGFGAETETSQYDIEKFVGEFGETKQVRLRRGEDGAFKGSVFVEFSNGDDAVKFVEKKPSFNGEELLVMSKDAYTKMKAAEHGFSSNANGRRRRFNAFKERSGKGRKGSRGGKSFKGRKGQDNDNKRPRDEAEDDKDAKVAKVEVAEAEA